MRGTRKTIENIALVVAVRRKVLFDNTYHEFVRREPAALDDLFHLQSEFRPALNFVSDDLAGRDVVKAVLLTQHLRLGSLPCSGRAEQDYVYHKVDFWLLSD